VFLRTGVVVIVKLRLVVPAATSTLAGDEATDDFALASVTVAPLEGAGALSVTVPVTEPPPLTLAGWSVSEASAADAGGLTVSVVVFVTPL
jgi:hypothetical protein